MLKLLRISLALIRIVLLVIPMAVLVLLYLGLIKLFVKHTHSRAFALRRWYLKYCNLILGIRTDIEGKMTKGVALYVSNHRSMSDPLILLQYLDAYVIAKAEVEKYPIISTGAELTGILYVKRENKNSRQAVRLKMKETLLNDHNVLVYPEGTVNYTKHTLPYRPGTFKEIISLGIPVVPVCLEYRDSKDVWCNRSMFDHFFLQFGYWRTYSKLVIGKPMSHSDGEELCKAVETWTNEQINRIHADWNSFFKDHDSILE